MFRKSNTQVHPHRTLNLGGLVALFAALCSVYYIFVKDKMLTFSVTSLLSSSSRLFNHWHVLAVGLVPVYLGLIIFGTAVLSLYIGSGIQHWLTKNWRDS